MKLSSYRCTDVNIKAYQSIPVEMKMTVSSNTASAEKSKFEKRKKSEFCIYSNLFSKVLYIRSNILLNIAN